MPGKQTLSNIKQQKQIYDLSIIIEKTLKHFAEKNMRIGNFIYYLMIGTTTLLLGAQHLAIAEQNSEMNAGHSAKAQQKINWAKRYRHIDPETGFRTAYYRAGLPPVVPGGTRITVEKAKALFETNEALFIDVMAHTGTGPDPIDGHWRLAEPRSNIPGSTWLADVGTGTLTPSMTRYFKSNLEKLTRSEREKPLVIYCTADCWMAWNAVKRAAGWGYKNLLWFPEGTDEWREKGLPLENAKPVPLKILDE